MSVNDRHFSAIQLNQACCPMRNFRSVLLFQSFLLPFPSPVAADEIWDSDIGPIVYEKDADTWAIWSFPGGGGMGSGPGKIFLEDLGGVWSNRGTYRGYWVSHGSTAMACANERVDAEGQAAAEHGLFEVSFLDPEFPARWSARWGNCDDEPSIELNATPRVGD